MSTSFAEFLRDLAAKHGQEAANRDGVLAEWFDSLKRLYDTLRDWLKASDPDLILKLHDRFWEVREEGLGSYYAPSLSIRGPGLNVGLLPKARNTVATGYPHESATPQRAAGRVDILDDGGTRYVLYRFKTDTSDEWFIEDQKSSPRPFTQQEFERVLMSSVR